MSKKNLFDKDKDLANGELSLDGATVQLKVDGRDEMHRGKLYRASQSTEDAVNAAIMLERPLLVSGEPGCGKTELGFAIARNLGIPHVWFFPVKSDSESSQLFYEYDAVRRFHDSQIQDSRSKDPKNYISYRALGRSILQALSKSDVRDFLTDEALGQHPNEPRQSVVIIDEIDKAPRDFPNDLLNELDQMWFRVPELAIGTNKIETPSIQPGKKPIVVITSNVEKQLPDAFLRRCIYCSIEFPTSSDGLLEDIVSRHLNEEKNPPATSEISIGIEFVERLRDEKLDKKPGLSELLEFLRALARQPIEGKSLDFKQRARACIGTLSKTNDDRDKAVALLTNLTVS